MSHGNEEVNPAIGLSDRHMVAVEAIRDLIVRNGFTPGDAAVIYATLASDAIAQCRTPERRQEALRRFVSAVEALIDGGEKAGAFDEADEQYRAKRAYEEANEGEGEGEKR